MSVKKPTSPTLRVGEVGAQRRMRVLQHARICCRTLTRVASLRDLSRRRRYGSRTTVERMSLVQDSRIPRWAWESCRDVAGPVQKSRVFSLRIPPRSD